MLRLESSLEREQAARRPPSILILSALQILQAAALAGFGVDLVLRYSWPGVKAPVLPGSSLAILYEYLISGFALVLYALPVVVASFALLKLRPWAWTASVAMQGLGLFICLVGYAVKHPNYPAMLLGIILVFYLNQREVQSMFRAG